MIRALIVDDSATARGLLTRELEALGDVRIVGAAKDAIEARRMIKELDPDVVTLDIEMPGMDGLSFLEKVMELRPTPVIMVTSRTAAHDDLATRALAIGAAGVYAKPSDGCWDRAELARLVRAAARQGPQVRSQRARMSQRREPPLRPRVIAIGSSTGGIEALQDVLGHFPEDCPPTLVVQHIKAPFSASIVVALDGLAKPKVSLARSDEPLAAGHVYVAPGGDKHLLLASAGRTGLRCVLRDGDPVSGHRPSVDRLFSSVAEVAGGVACGVLLTGMGEDGARGLLEMRERGAFTLAQDEASSVVFGMPRAAIQRGAVSEVLPLSQIGARLFARQAAPA
ncbi:protein-glutamate methylesterase/protein-glutamine glutaminase [Erythrobacter sp.]|jgi:two-component system chemotaxis response regulator CheB|uniref:protein-glutamate methylesterase/protein-glutamine glutaminase n=1 Tax=Erythrobacter sp. TaxID=1042 RepID=UPI002EB4DCA5|nr:chemotaxis response regulator protein-glutamate methylesterase [Erythrobacter sp.]